MAKEEMSFGKFFKAMRAKRGLSLRKFCVENGLDPGNISKLERGVMPPPQTREKLEEYAKVLLIPEGSDDWYEFFDLASTATGRIPPDIMGDEELVKRLPLVFRTVRGQKMKISDDQLDELAEVIRRA
jgi:transcriptional regulator with XRE-family HTH domain